MKKEYICPVLTMFKEDGSLDFQGMKCVVDRLINNGIDGIAFFGSSGEFYSMTYDNIKIYSKQLIDYVNKRVKIYIGTGRLIVEETVELSNYAIESGADGVLVVGPYYIGASQEGIEKYYDKIIGEIKGNVMIYNYPERTGYDILGTTVVKLLSSHKNLIGIKDTVSNPLHTTELIKKVKSQFPNFKIYTGFDNNLSSVILSGGDGCIGALSNLVPDVCAKWIKSFENENLKEVMKIQKYINDLMDFYQISTPFMPVMKYSLKKLGLPVLEISKFPAIQLNDKQKKQVENLLGKIENNFKGGIYVK